MPATMPGLSRRRLLCLFLIACLAALLLSIAGSAGKPKETDNGDAKFRVLRGIDTLGRMQKQRHGHGISPASAPAPAAARARLPLLHKDARLPVPGKVTHNHKRGGSATAPRQSPPRGGGGKGEGEGEGGSRKKSMPLAVVAAAAALSGAALVLLAVLVVFLACKKLQGRRGGGGDQSGGTNKVSFEPGPGMFYLDAIKPYLDDAGRDSEGKAAPEIAAPKDEEPKRDDEEGDGACSDDDGAQSVHSSCCFQSSHFSYSELAKGGQADGVSPSPSVRSKRRGSAPTTPSDKAKVASPYSPLGPRTPSSEERGRRTHSPSSTSVSVLTEQSFNDHEIQGTAHSVRSLKFHGGGVCHAKEAGAETDAASRKTVPPPPPPPPPPMMVKQQQIVQMSCGTLAVPAPPPPPPPLLIPQRQNGQRSNGPTLPPPQAPPPGLFRQTAPVGKNGAPLPKLKPLHWDKVRAAPNRRMVWDRIRSSSFELDEQTIESLFGYNAAARCSVKLEEGQGRSPSLGHHVLDPKRLQNITILMKAVNATADQIYAALLQGNGLSVQQLEALIKMAPTKEEVEKLESYDGDIGSLVAAERLVKVALTIPCAFARVEAMLYRETFADEVIHIRKSFAVLEGADVKQAVPEAAGGRAEDREPDERRDGAGRRHGVQAGHSAQARRRQGHRREDHAAALRGPGDGSLPEATRARCGGAGHRDGARRRAHQRQEDGDRRPGRAHHLGVEPLERPVPDQGASGDGPAAGRRREGPALRRLHGPVRQPGRGGDQGAGG
ncbi:Formin-like protein 11 [Zea mays]|uniref:Formin-like protein n=1 Tax=Zea mays TaxID=4577 RepID=A0A1D6E938_MAIZE|nr:Formin-like protein 11 [Zea mays]